MINEQDIRNDINIKDFVFNPATVPDLAYLKQFRQDIYSKIIEYINNTFKNLYSIEVYQNVSPFETIRGICDKFDKFNRRFDISDIRILLGYKGLSFLCHWCPELEKFTFEEIQRVDPTNAFNGDYFSHWDSKKRRFVK